MIIIIQKDRPKLGNTQLECKPQEYFSSQSSVTFKMCEIKVIPSHRSLYVINKTHPQNKTKQNKTKNKQTKTKNKTKQQQQGTHRINS